MDNMTVSEVIAIVAAAVTWQIAHRCEIEPVPTGDAPYAACQMFAELLEGELL